MNPERPLLYAELFAGEAAPRRDLPVSRTAAEDGGECVAYRLLVRFRNRERRDSMATTIAGVQYPHWDDAGFVSGLLHRREDAVSGSIRRRADLRSLQLYGPRGDWS
jgi:hypothetical protein